MPDFKKTMGKQRESIGKTHVPRYGLGGFPPYWFYCGVLALLPSRSEQREVLLFWGI